MIMDQQKPEENKLYLTPRQIVLELDKYIIGQHNAKRHVAIALRNRWRRMTASEEMKKEIVPNNILMIGSTGVGKTEIARRLAKVADAPFTKVEASKFTEVGYVGRDVESMVRDLVEQSVHMVKTQKKQEVYAKATQLVEDVILDALIPPLKKHDGISSGDSSDQDLNERTRESFREKLKRGELEERKIDINVQQSSSPGVGMIGGAMDEAAMMNIQEMIGNMMPKKQKKRKVTIADARKILLEEEAAKMIDMDEVKEEALRKAENLGIIFIDEIDKIASRSNKGGGGPDVSREGVQRDLLPIVEGSSINTKYGVINTDHILFIAAGAFHVSKPSDLIPELQGRFPIRVELDGLSEDDFYQILKAPKNALTKQYQALLSSEEVSLEFTDESLRSIANVAFRANEEMENIGARRLHTVLERLLEEISYGASELVDKNILVDVGYVNKYLNPLIKDDDLSRYIL